MFSVELLPAATELGLSDAVGPLGLTLALRLTVPPLPTTAVEMVLLPLAPCWMLTLLGAALMLKSGGGGGAVTVTLAVPLTFPLDAVTVKGPPAVEPAVNKPDALMVPPPLTDQAKVG